MGPAVKQTIKEVSISLGAFLAAGEVVCAFTVGGFITQWNALKLTCMSGLLLGTLLAAALLIHMAITMEKAMEQGAGAQKHILISFFIRYITVAVVLVASYYSGIFNLFAVLIGLFFSKPALYLQPLVHKWTHGIDYDADVPPVPDEEWDVPTPDHKFDRFAPGWKDVWGEDPLDDSDDTTSEESSAAGTDSGK